jgi:hypothetical protein
MANAGGPTVPNAASVVSPTVSVATSSSVSAAVAEVAGSIRSGSAAGTNNVDGSVSYSAPSGASITINAAGTSFTITTAGGTSVVVSSSFVASIFYAYL